MRAAGGEWRLAVYANTLDYAEHLVLTKGDLAAPLPAMVRMHAVDLVSDVLGGPQESSLHDAIIALPAAPPPVADEAGGQRARPGGPGAVATT